MFKLNLIMRLLSRKCFYFIFTAMEPPGVQINDKTGLIVGATLGGFVFIIVLVVLGYYLYRNYRWKYFLRKPITAQEYVNEATNFTTAYPVTKLYYREE